MPRDASPPELSSLERTALWVQAQASLAHASPESSQPPSPARSSTKTMSSYRNTTSSDDTSLKPSLARSPSTHQSVRTHTHTRCPSTTATQRPRYDSRARRSSLPFPQSPPGSGYPMVLEVVAPRRPESVQEQEQKASRISLTLIVRTALDAKDPFGCPQVPSTPRPSLRKQRRPSLIEQIISFGAPSQRRKDEPSGKKA